MTRSERQPERRAELSPDLEEAGPAAAVAEERISLASNWTLVW